MSVHEPLTRRQERAMIRGDRSGSGPTLDERPPARFPGAAAKFALFGEVLMTGMLILLVGLLVVTLPAGLAAGIRHLRRYVAAEDSRLGLFWADVRAALLPGAVVGLGVAVATVVLLLDLDLAGSGVLPGGPLVQVVGWAGLVVLVVALLWAAGEWSPERGWRAALRAVPQRVRADAAGSVYLAVAGGLVVFLTWTLPPLLIAGLGCTALAVVAVPARRRRAD